MTSAAQNYGQTQAVIQNIVNPPTPFLKIASQPAYSIGKAWQQASIGGRIFCQIASIAVNPLSAVITQPLATIAHLIQALREKILQKTTSSEMDRQLHKTMVREHMACAQFSSIMIPIHLLATIAPQSAYNFYNRHSEGVKRRDANQNVEYLVHPSLPSWVKI